ncbi:hypothetical protein GOP47_0026047 [Adiantum capillus-veneris]|uniref:Secreted protein n=1 Tax=Adiantum capillus-veneris TaxID=13818 RepID=A0A9D4U1L7_ADICA|nr:hypothetical protein GOP47_0026047 [Adiantum capillus-veneris]
MPCFPLACLAWCGIYLTVCMADMIGTCGLDGHHAYLNLNGGSQPQRLLTIELYPSQRPRWFSAIQNRHLNSPSAHVPREFRNPIAENRYCLQIFYTCFANQSRRG